MGQERPKYHVTDEGKVFVVNDDGTTTEYGRVVPEKRKEKRPRKPIPCIVWWIVAIVFLIVVSFGVTFQYKLARIAEYPFDPFEIRAVYIIFDSLVPLSWLYIGLMLLVLILIGCVIRLNNKMRAIK